MGTYSRPSSAVYLAVEAGVLLALSALSLTGGVSHQYLTRVVLQAIVGVIATGWLASHLWCGWPWHRRRIWHATPLDRPLVVGLCITALSSLLGLNPRLSLESAGLILACVFGFWFCHEQVRAGWFAGLLIKCLLLVAAVVWLLSAVEMLVWYVGWPEGPAWPALGFGLKPPAILRAGCAPMRSNHMAGYVAPLVPLVFAIGMSTQSRARRCVLLVAGTLLVALEVGTGSKGGTLGMLVGLSALAFGAWLARSAATARFRITKRQLILAGLTLAALSLLGMLTAAYVMGRGGDAAIRSIASRFDIWVVALRSVADHPLLGVGPGNFGLTYLQHRDPIQPTTPYNHAHNMLLHILATTGIAGGLAALWLVVIFVLAFWRLWRTDPDTRQRWLRLGAACGLVTFAVHGLVDTLFIFPPIALVVVILASLALRPNTELPSSAPGPRHWWIKPAIASAALVAWLGTGAWIDAGVAAFDRATAASRRGDWGEAASALQEAARVDPGFGYYRLQLGLAYGRLADLDPTYLEDAVAAYRSAGIEIDPFAPNRLNFAHLLWQSGDLAGAIGEMAEAARLMLGRLPQEHYVAGLYRLNLGSTLEAVKRTDEARSEYARAVGLAPALLSTSFWDAEGSGVRDRTAIALAALDLLENSPEGVSGLQRAEFAYLLRRWDAARVWAEATTREDPTQADAWLCLGRTELDAGHARQALSVADQMERAGGMTSASLLLRTMAHLELGNLDEAARHLRALQFAPLGYHACVPSSLIKDYTVHLLAARLAERQGDPMIARDEFQAAGQAAAAPQLSLYGHDVWVRDTLATETTAFVLNPLVMDAQAEAYLGLGDVYARQGLHAEARQAFQAVLSIIPGDVRAQQGLSALGE